MTARTSSATERALAAIAAGATAYRAARMHGIALSTIYRALKRQRVAAPVSAPGSAAERTRSEPHAG